ncbi:MAG: DUF501 domain-containing protein [Cellvibrionales bacterium]|nr:DUF501 domain-containing protein [Cellvibrionales bacterium]
MLSEQEIGIITEQIGRAPRGAVKVVAQSGGVPLVLKMRSVVEGKPFPTLYWLTSKTLYKAIAGLETAGLVKELEQKIVDDASFKQAYLEDQARYIHSRTDSMLPEDKQSLIKMGLFEKFQQQGIGGLANLEQIRCLHMQYAFHLAEGSVIGDYLDQHHGLSALDITG